MKDDGKVRECRKCGSATALCVNPSMNKNYCRSCWK